MAKAKPGISDTVTFTFRHEARSRAYDMRGSVPIVESAGGPEFVVRDWIEYPDSLKVIEELWTDVDYLYFNRRDAWYYQLTRDDLARLNTSLADFLKEMHETVSQDDAFKTLATGRRLFQSQVAELKATVSDRIKDPKPLRDLVPWWD